MKTLITPLLILSLLALPSFASDLPPCPKDQTPTSQTYHNCFGTYTFTDGDKYIGDWKDGAIHGQGTMIYADGRVYKGKYKVYARTQGTMEWPDGFKYTGKWGEDGQNPNGFGTYTSPDGASYVGEWKDGKIMAKVRTLTLMAMKYVGEWKG